MSTKLSGLLAGGAAALALTAAIAVADDYRAAGGFPFTLFGNKPNSTSTAHASNSPSSNGSQQSVPSGAGNQNTSATATTANQVDASGAGAAASNATPTPATIDNTTGGQNSQDSDNGANASGSHTPRKLSERLKAIRSGDGADDAVADKPATSAPTKTPTANQSATLPSSRRSLSASDDKPAVVAPAKRRFTPIAEDSVAADGDTTGEQVKPVTPHRVAVEPAPAPIAPEAAPRHADVAAPIERPPHADGFAHSQAAPAPVAVEMTPAKSEKHEPHFDKPESTESIRTPRSAEVVEAAPGISSSGGVLFARQSPLISVETAGPRTITIGKAATYTVTIKNSGEVAAQDVSVSLKIPEWTDIAGSQASNGTAHVGSADNPEPFTWKIPRLDAHGKETLSLEIVPHKGRSFDLGVQWTISPIASQTMVEVQEPKLNMSIAGPDEVTFGQSKIYRLTLANPGTGDAENVVIQLQPVGSAAAAPTRHPIGTLKAGESKVIELELTARQSGTLTVRASASADGNLQSDAAQDVLVRRAAVAVAIDGAKTRYAGTMATYGIAVSNPGNATAENVKITANLPQGAKFVAASAGGQYRAEQGKVVWSVPALKAGEDTAFELKCALTAPGPNRLQVVTAAAADVGDIAAFTTNVEALADLKMEVVDPAGPIAVGDEVVYELKVMNRGTKSAEGVAVVAYFSEGLEPVSAQGAPNDIANGVVAFHAIDTLAAGADATFKIRARAQKSGKQIFRSEIECGALGTKLVNAEEMLVYGGDTPDGRADRAVARRPGEQDGAAERGDAAPIRR